MVVPSVTKRCTPCSKNFSRIRASFAAIARGRLRPSEPHVSENSWPRAWRRRRSCVGRDTVCASQSNFNAGHPRIVSPRTKSKHLRKSGLQDASPVGRHRVLGGPQSISVSQQRSCCEALVDCVSLRPPRGVGTTPNWPSSLPHSKTADGSRRRRVGQRDGRSGSSSRTWSNAAWRSAMSQQPTSTRSTSTWRRGGRGSRCVPPPAYSARGLGTARGEVGCALGWPRQFTCRAFTAMRDCLSVPRGRPSAASSKRPTAMTPRRSGTMQSSCCSRSTGCAQARCAGCVSTTLTGRAIRFASSVPRADGGRRPLWSRGSATPLHAICAMADPRRPVGSPS